MDGTRCGVYKNFHVGYARDLEKGSRGTAGHARLFEALAPVQPRTYIGTLVVLVVAINKQLILDNL